jgi:hypothetical protein
MILAMGIASFEAGGQEHTPVDRPVSRAASPHPSLQTYQIVPILRWRPSLFSNEARVGRYRFIFGGIWFETRN